MSLKDKTVPKPVKLLYRITYVLTYLKKKCILHQGVCSAPEAEKKQSHRHTTGFIGRMNLSLIHSTEVY